MSDTTDTTATAPAETPATETVTAETADAQAEVIDYKAEAEKWKALSRKNEDEKKANAEKAKAYDEFQESQKTETQKAIDRAAAAEARAVEAEQKATRSEIARTTGVPVELLAGTTAEELQASADALLAFRGTQPTAARTGGADINGGSAKPATYTREQLADPAFFQAHRADILAAQVQGRITT